MDFFNEMVLWCWLQDGAWRVAVGTQLNCSGTALLYSTQDFQSYTYDGVLASQIGIAPNGSCADDGVGSTGSCNQFGTGCRMWECVDAIHVGPVMAIKWSDQVRSLEPPGIDPNCSAGHVW